MFNQSGLFFVPRRLQSVVFLRWLKRVHAWTGFWGALFFLLMGSSGFMLNHRSVLKIDTGAPVEVSSVELPVAPGAITDVDTLGKWAKQALSMPVDAKPPRPEGGLPKGPKGGGEARFMGKDMKAAEIWTQAFTMPDAKVTVTYVPGSNHATAKRENVGFLGTLKNMHKGTGLPVAWVLLIDTIAGALITMALTGFLLWSRLHGTRLLAGTLVSGSLIWAITAAFPAMG
ncbi:MAG: PepSY-associated TM helix domain-containing protein [Sphingomonadales bacterium]